MRASDLAGRPQVDSNYDSEYVTIKTAMDCGTVIGQASTHVSSERTTLHKEGSSSSGTYTCCFERVGFIWTNRDVWAVIFSVHRIPP